MAEEAQDWKYVDLPGNDDILAMTDYGRHLAGASTWVLGIRLNRALDISKEAFYAVLRLVDEPRPVAVEGSSKAGIPIQHPRYSVEWDAGLSYGTSMKFERGWSAAAYVGRWFVVAVRTVPTTPLHYRALSPPFFWDEPPLNHSILY